MAYNQTDLLQFINMELGAYIRPLELSNDELMKIVEVQTLTIFSKYFPHMELITVNFKHDSVPEKQGWYYINTDFIILGVARIYPSNFNASLYNNYSMTYNEPVTAKMAADQMSYVENPLLWEFHSPNIIEIFPKYWQYTNTNFGVQIKVVHPIHLKTIPPNLFDHFRELAKLDVFIALGKIRKYYSTISTTFGNIELFLDELNDAKSERKELIEKFQSKYSRYHKRKKLFIY